MIIFVVYAAIRAAEKRGRTACTAAIASPEVVIAAATKAGSETFGRIKRGRSRSAAILSKVRAKK